MAGLTRSCEVAGCEREHYARGMCTLHWKRNHRHGSPLIVLPFGERHDPIAVRLAERSVRNGACLIYEKGKPLPSGHKQIGHNGKKRGVHVVAWELANGRPRPAGLVVRHSCDVPACIEPSHLLLGTVADNNLDRVVRGRSAHMVGELSSRSKLTEADARQVLALLSSGYTRRDIGLRFGVTEGCIGFIARGETWRHIGRKN